MSSFSPDLVVWGFVIIVLWIVVGWIIELTVVVLGVQVRFDGVGNSKEVGHVLRVGEVLVKVVLEMLEHVHVLLDHCVSSNSWERERLVIKLPGVNVDLWLLTGFGHSLGNVADVSPVSWVKSSGEHVNLVAKLFLGLIKVDAWSLKSALDGSSRGGIGGNSHTEEKCNNGGESHPT